LFIIFAFVKNKSSHKKLIQNTMKLTKLFPVAAIAALTLVSCGGSKNNANDANNTTTEASANNAAPAQSSNEQALANAKSFFGWIQSIDGNTVTIKNANGEEIKVNIANAGDELIEGSPITVKYVTVEDGSNKTATDDASSVTLSKNFKKLLGKWTTEGDKIFFELRKSGKVKATETSLKSWRVADENTIEFEIGDNVFDKWTVETLDDNNLVLKHGDGADAPKIPMTRKDSNRE
jgi:hypothetical protein